MTATRKVFYRAESPRWAFLLTGLVIAFTLSPLGPPRWRSTPSLNVIHRVTGTWWIVSALFALYVALLATNRLKLIIAANFLGLWLYACGLVALLVTVRLDQPTNPIVVCALALACVLHYAAARLALLAMREREQAQ